MSFIAVTSTAILAPLFGLGVATVLLETLRFVSGTYHHRSQFFPPSKVCVLPAIVLEVLNRVFLRSFYEHNSAQVKTFGETTNHTKSQQLCDTELISGVIAWFDVASQLL